MTTAPKHRTEYGHPAPERPGPHDFLSIETRLSDEERGIRDDVRTFVQERIEPNILEWWEGAIFPRELVPEMGNLGLLGMHLSGYGCAGKSAVAYGLGCTELEAGDSGDKASSTDKGAEKSSPSTEKTASKQD